MLLSLSLKAVYSAAFRYQRSATLTDAKRSKVFIQTHGCQMNEYDSARMGDLLKESHGMEQTQNAEEADVLLLNTCSIREKAQEKVFHQLGRWKAIKVKRPDVVIGVGGCVASQEGEAISERAPYVDLIFGPQTLHRLPEMLDDRGSSGSAVVDISFPEIEKFDRLPQPSTDSATAFVSVMEGCSKYCTFCVVPYTRGEEVSRPVDDVIAEVAHLADSGVKEINLLGQNVNAYRGHNHLGEIVDFAELITLVNMVPGIERIRFHDLRHTFASHWMLKGGDLYRLQKILGHKSIAMTQRYAHLSPDAFQQDWGRFGDFTPPAGEVRELQRSAE